MVSFYIFSINMFTSMQTQTNSVRKCWRRWAGQKEKDSALMSKALQNFPEWHTRVTQLVTKTICDFYIEAFL